MSDSTGSYSEALAGLREAFKDEPEKHGALALVLGSLVDRIRDLEDKVQANKDQAASEAFYARSPRPTGGGPLRG